MLRRIAMQTGFAVALTVFTVSLFMVGALTVNAQPLPPDRSDARGEELLKSLKLDAAKSTTVQNILDSERQAMRALNDSIRPQRDAIRQATRKKLVTTLTPDQLQRYDQWVESHRPPRPPDGGSSSSRPQRPR